MNFKSITRIAVIAASFALATSAFASSNSGSISLTQAASLQGTQLAAGAYKVQWQGSGDNVTVAISQGKKLIATVPAHLMDLAKADDGNTVIVTGSKGNRKIAELHFAGKKQALALGTQPASSSSSGN